MSQIDMIFQHLLSGQQITPLCALSKYGCMSLAQRIYDIKDELRTNPLYKGWYIVTHMVEKNGKRFGSYELVKTELEVAA